MENNDKDKNFMTEHQATTAGVAAVKIIKLFGTQENLFPLSTDPAEIAKYNVAYQNMLAEILVVFAENNVGFTNYDFVFNGIKSVVSALQEYVKNHFNNLKEELDSRYVGARNPKSGKYDIHHATHVQMMDALMRIRKDQGDNPADYFFIEKEENKESTGEPVKSPIQKEDLDAE